MTSPSPYPSTNNEYFASELERLRQMAADGLVTIEPRAVQVTSMGWFFVRAVAMVFDRYLKPASTTDAPAEAPLRFSRIL